MKKYRKKSKGPYIIICTKHPLSDTIVSIAFKDSANGVDWTLSRGLASTFKTKNEAREFMKLIRPNSLYTEAIVTTKEADKMKRKYDLTGEWPK